MLDQSYKFKKKKNCGRSKNPGEALLKVAILSEYSQEEI